MGIIKSILQIPNISNKVGNHLVYHKNSINFTVTHAIADDIAIRMNGFQIII